MAKAKKKSCKFGVSKTTGKCLKHPRVKAASKGTAKKKSGRAPLRRGDRVQLGGAVRTCVKFQRVSVKGQGQGLRCKEFAPAQAAGYCPRPYPLRRKGFAECTGRIYPR